MLSVLFVFSLLGCSVVGIMLLWFAYFGQYRFASYFFDVLPYYPFLVILLSFVGVIGSLVLFLTISRMFLFLTSLLVTNFAFQFLLFWNWSLTYRIDKLQQVFEKMKCSSQLQLMTINELVTKTLNRGDKITVHIRHDVDINLKRAQNMARLEQMLKIPACYYLRNDSEQYTFKEAESFIQQLSTLPLFEIGFHYMSISKSRGDLKQATELFVKEVQQFRQISPLSMVCPHGDSEYNNGQIESKKLVDFSEHGLISAYKPPYDYYIHDSGGYHYFPKENGRKTFLQLLESIFLLPEGSLVHINIHPDWWF